MIDAVDLARALRSSARQLAGEAAEQRLLAHPDLVARYGDVALERCREDGASHIEHLAAAVATGQPALFDDYVAWLRALLLGRGLEDDDIAAHLQELVSAIGAQLGNDARAAVVPYVESSLAASGVAAAASSSLLDPDAPYAALAARFLETILARDRHSALRMVTQAADGGTEVADLYLHVFAPALREVGRRWQSGEATVGQEHLVTAVTQLAMAQLYPRTFMTPRVGRTVVVASVGGELHEVGAHMVADLFELAGWDSHFLGANTPSQSVIDLVTASGSDVLALSVTIPSHVPVAMDLISACRTARPDTAILVGGRPFTLVADLWERVGADATANDARAAVTVATSLVGAA